MSTAQSHLQRRQRPSSACKRCKDQHIRCDAETKGLPCSHCRRVGNAGCHIAKTKRTRGSNGRFVTSELLTSEPRDPDPMPQPSQTTRISDRVPPFSIDFEALCNRHRRRRYVSSDGSAGGQDSLYASTRHRQASAPPIWGESWYLSYVIQTTNSDHDCLYRPILGKQEKSSRDDSNPVVPHRPRRDYRTTALPRPELVNDLLRGYFTIFHPFCPIIDREVFLDSVRDGSVSKVLLRCVLFIASIHCDLKTIHLLGYSGRIEAEDDLFSSAKAAFDCDQESDRLVMLLCSYLLHYWSGSASQSRDSLWWLAGTIRSAQCMQMHRKAQQKSVRPEQERMWRRIWWLLYIRDRQISISLGKPMIIHDCDCDVEFLNEEDLLGESPETVAYVLAQARLSVVVSNALRTYFAPSSKSSASDETLVLNSICTVFSTWEESLSPGLNCDTTGSSQLPLILNLTSNYYRIIVHQTFQRTFQGLPPNLTTASNDIIMDAAERITSMTEDAVTHHSGSHFPMICVSAIFAAMTAQFTQANASNQSAMTKSTLLSSIKYKLLALKDFEECHVLAGWIRQLFFDMFDQQRRQDRADRSPENPREQESAIYGEYTDAPNSETPQTYEDPSMALDVDSIIADIPRQAPWAFPPTMPNDNIIWHNWLLGYQDGG